MKERGQLRHELKTPSCTPSPIKPSEDSSPSRYLNAATPESMENHPGESGVPSEDALVLQLESTKGQEKFVEMLKSQHMIIAHLQQKLTKQQQILISQQQTLLDQWKKMHEQMNLMKVQHGI